MGGFQIFVAIVIAIVVLRLIYAVVRRVRWNQRRRRATPEELESMSPVPPAIFWWGYAGHHVVPGPHSGASGFDGGFTGGGDAGFGAGAGFDGGGFGGGDGGGGGGG